MVVILGMGRIDEEQWCNRQGGRVPPRAGLISKAVKTYFDQKAVKTRLKPVKTGLNRSKGGQNLKLWKMCQRL